MAHQWSVAVRNAQADAVETEIGTAPTLELWNGTIPANCAASDTGTEIANGTLPSDWMAAASGGSKAKNGTWEATGLSAAGAGTDADYYRLTDGSTTCHAQGTVGTPVALTTNALTATNGNVLNFASTTGAVVGQRVSGTGIVDGTTVVAVTATTVTLSKTSTAGVANSASITFGYDMNLDNVSVADGQTITVSSYDIPVSGA